MANEINIHKLYDFIAKSATIFLLQHEHSSSSTPFSYLYITPKRNYYTHFSRITQSTSSTYHATLTRMKEKKKKKQKKSNEFIMRDVTFENHTERIRNAFTTFRTIGHIHHTRKCHLSYFWKHSPYLVSHLIKILSIISFLTATDELIRKNVNYITNNICPIKYSSDRARLLNLIMYRMCHPSLDFKGAY